MAILIFLFLITLVILSFCGLFMMAIKSIVKENAYRYDDRNPYRRYCKKCEQEQNAYGHIGSRINNWEDVYPIKNKNCSCNKENK